MIYWTRRKKFISEVFMERSMMEKWGNPQQKMFGLPQFLVWFTFTATILGVAVLTGIEVVWANIPLNVLAGVLVLIFCKPVMFERLKLTTLLVLRAVIVLAFLGVFPRQYYVLLVKIFLIINILEATFTDLLKNKQYFNFVSGLALAAGVFGLKGLWAMDNPMYTFDGINVWATIAYIAGYTLWNWIFVSGEFSPSVSLMHFGFLGAPIIGSVILGPGYWLLMRANTLTFGGIMQIAGKNYWEENLQNNKFTKFIDWTHKAPVQIVAMIINVGLMLFVLLSYFLA